MFLHAAALELPLAELRAPEQRPLRIEFERVDDPKKGRLSRFGPTKKAWAALSGAW